jgi:hypothetical protein
MGIDKAKEIIHDARIKIMELPYFDQKLDIVTSLLNFEWDLEQEHNEFSHDNELAEEVFDDHEPPWSE